MRPSHRLNLALCAEFSDCPFLYRTETILRQHAWNRPRRPISTTARRARTSSEEPSFLKRKAAEIRSNKSNIGSSMTAAEEAAFDDLWKLLEKPSQSARQTSTDHTDTDHRKILEMFSSLPYDSSETKLAAPVLDNVEQQVQPEVEISINQDSAKARKSRVFGTGVKPTMQPKLNREGAMAEIQSFLKDATVSVPDRSFSLSNSKSADDVQSVAANIVEDTADSLAAALISKDPRPDIAMWRVAESKIFPLIKLLHTPSSSHPPSKSSTSSPKDSSPKLPRKLAEIDNPRPQTQSTDHQQQLHPLIPPDLPILPVLRSTYPSLTLLILRLFSTHHPTSPYLLALLPKIKSLGSTSYVLGAHTHFFNTLLSIYWRIYSDLQGMNNLLTEMETNGVEFDIGTWDVLRDIMRDRERDLNGDESESGGIQRRGLTWWNSLDHDFYLQRVGVVWKDVVKGMLEEKGVSTGEVMREGVVHPGASRDSMEEEKPEYVVVL